MPLSREAVAQRNKRAEEQIRHMARHDSLTGLPNRAAFRDEMEQSLKRVRRGQILQFLAEAQGQASKPLQPGLFKM